MIRRTVRIQLVVFLLITLLGIAYAGFRYVGLGQQYYDKPFIVTALSSQSGGIFVNAEVTLRGVQIGKVTKLDLTDDGRVAIDLSIDNKYNDTIPSDTKAVVANLSAVGEQYVDLQPATDNGPYLADGDTIDHVDVPLDNAKFLLDLDKLVNSVDKKKLAIVISQLDKAFAGSGPDLARLIERGNSLNRTMLAAIPQTVRLIDDGRTVLDTQQAVSGDLRSFSRNLALLSESIHAHDPSYAALIDNGVKSAHEVEATIQENAGNLGVLLDNLVTLSGIQSAPVRLDGLRTILTIYPSTVYNGFRAAPGDNKAHFGIVADQNPPNCETYQNGKNKPGYLGPGFPPRRDGSGQHKSDLGGKAKGNADCLLNKGSATDVRGARNAPRPKGDNTGDPSTWPAWVPMAPSSSGSSHSSSSGAIVAHGTATYDPVTDLLMAPDGQVFTIGTDGGQADYFGADAWKWLLVAPTIG